MGVFRLKLVDVVGGVTVTVIWISMAGLFFPVLSLIFREGGAREPF